MSELSSFAAEIQASWQSDSTGGGPLLVSDLLDRVYPYALARRRLGIDVSEDYEALALRLIAGQEGLAEVSPADAGELARVTMDEKLPDLTVLQLLRGARLTLHVAPSVQRDTPPASATSSTASAARAAGMPSPASVAEAAVATGTARGDACWNCNETLPAGRSVKFCTFCGADQRPPVCQRCNEPLERGWRHCPECGERV